LHSQNKYATIYVSRPGEEANLSLKDRIATALFADTIAEQVAEAVKVIDDEFWRRYSTATADALLPDSPLKAYRTNPLAFRLVQIMVNHVLGDGVTWTIDDKDTATWLRKWWNHPDNLMPTRIRQWLTELTLTGDLFPTFHTRLDGLSIMRAVPSSSVDEIETNDQDLEDELRYHQMGTADNPDGVWWTSTRYGGRMMHFTVNRPVGYPRGQSDLTTVLPWLKRYSTWLKDRVAINKAKSAFTYDVTIKGTEADVQRRRAELGTPPKPGSVIIHNDAEEWKSVAPNVDAGEAAMDGKALRLMIAAGVGLPLHFLSEGDQATRATAKEMGEPTRRAFAERQKVFAIILQTVAKEAIQRAISAGAPLPLDAASLIPTPTFPDLTREDNYFLAQAASQIVPALQTAVERGWLTDTEAAAWLRKFAGESTHGIHQEE